MTLLVREKTVLETGALAGVRIVDLTWMRAGPQTTRILAMLGAEVIRVEYPGAPDIMRYGGPRNTPKGVTPGINTNGDFNNFSCNKLSCTLNARDPKGKEALKRLIAVSDVVVENFSSRVLETWGLDYEVQRKVNPSIIYVSMAGFGHSGPWRDYDTWGPAVQAISGLTFVSGMPNKPPSAWGQSYMDQTGGYYGAMGILMALHYRARTGRGQYVDMSQVEAGCTLTGAAILDYTVNGRPTRRPGFPTGNRTYWPGYPITNSYRGRHAAPHNNYRTSGGGHFDWCVIVCTSDDEWRSMVKAMGEPEWAKDPKLGTQLGRLLHQEEMDKRINEWTKGFNKYDLVADLQAAGVPSAPVNSMRERVEVDPQLKHRGLFARTSTHPLLGTHRHEGIPFQMSETPWDIWRHAPLLGMDQDYVFKELLDIDPANPPPAPEATTTSSPAPAGDQLVAPTSTERGWIAGRRDGGEVSAPGDAAGALALGDLRVLEVTDENGQFCGKLLADMGAEVIKVEPPGGSPTRSIGPFYGDAAGPERSLFFWHYNTSKKSVTLNLDTPDGQQLFRGLAVRADVVLEANPPGYMAKRGLGHEAIRQINPRIVYCSITPYGQTGPWAHYKATELCLMASGGEMGTSGYESVDDPDESPVAPGGGNGWHIGNHYAFMGIMAALVARGRRGTGQYIDVSLQDAIAVCTEGAFSDWEYMKGERRRQTGRHATVLPSPPVQFICKDGTYANTQVPSIKDKEWKALLEWLGSQGLAEDLGDPKYLDPNARNQAAHHVWDVIGRFCAHQRAEEMFHEGQKRKLPWTMVRAPSEIVDDPHLNARGFFVKVEHPELGRSFTYPGAPYQFKTSPWRIARRAPLVGEDNDAVLGTELGISRDRLNALAELGVI